MDAAQDAAENAICWIGCRMHMLHIGSMQDAAQDTPEDVGRGSLSWAGRRRECCMLESTLDVSQDVLEIT